MSSPPAKNLARQENEFEQGQFGEIGLLINYKGMQNVSSVAEKKRKHCH